MKRSKYWAVWAGTLLTLALTRSPASAEYIARDPHINTEQLMMEAGVKDTARLRRKVRSIKAENVPPHAIFLAVAEKAGMLVGVELTASDTKQKLVSLNVNSGTVMEVFDQVHFADQHYTIENWRNYVPRAYLAHDVRELGDDRPLPPEPDYPFLAKIDFKVRKSLPSAAVSQVLDIPSVKDRLRPGSSAAVLDTAAIPGKPELTMAKPDVRARQAVNLIALAAGRNWITREVNGVLEVRLFEKAVSVCPEVAKVYVELEPEQ